MKTKLEMAHEYAIALINSDCEMQFDKFIRLCWNYADAMQAEADKREKEEAEQKRKAVREMLNADNTFLEKEGQHFDDVANQKRTPKVSRFERSDAVKEVLNMAENMGLIKPKAIDDWQPDWSQAPDSLVKYFAVDENGRGGWFISKPTLWSDHWYWSDFKERLDNDNYDHAPSFGYTGDWRESLRKRPQ